MFRFPSSHYHGLTVAFDLETASSLSQQVQDFPVTPEQIITRRQLGDYPKVVHGADVMEHIFGEMYRVPEKIRIPYFRVKILEMLLYLDTISIPGETEEQPYFYRTQVEKVQAIRDFLAEHLSENHTQEELSRRFDLPLTAMKNCFRSAYGASMGAWLTDYRMNRAAELRYSPLTAAARFPQESGRTLPSPGFRTAISFAYRLLRYTASDPLSRGSPTPGCAPPNSHRCRTGP